MLSTGAATGNSIAALTETIMNHKKNTKLEDTAECEASKCSGSLPMKLRKSLIATVIGLPALVAFGYFTDWKAAVALFVVMYADNIDKGR